MQTYNMSLRVLVQLLMICTRNMGPPPKYRILPTGNWRYECRGWPVGKGERLATPLLFTKLKIMHPKQYLIAKESNVRAVTVHAVAFFVWVQGRAYRA